LMREIQEGMVLLEIVLLKMVLDKVVVTRIKDSIFRKRVTTLSLDRGSNQSL